MTVRDRNSLGVCFFISPNPRQKKKNVANVKLPAIAIMAINSMDMDCTKSSTDGIAVLQSLFTFMILVLDFSVLFQNKLWLANISIEGIISILSNLMQVKYDYC